MPRDTTLKAMRELGLVLFLIGAGVAGGSRFAEFFHPIYFVYGILMTALPMVVGYLFAKHVLKLSLLNNLGSITGGMTSTPALGTLISVAKTERSPPLTAGHLSHRAALGGGHLPSHYPCAVIALQGFQTQTESR